MTLEPEKTLGILIFKFDFKYWNRSIDYIRDFVSSVVTDNLPLMEQLHSMLYRYPAEKLILLENATDSYR